MILGLVEAGLIPSLDIPHGELPNEGLPGEVKKLWALLDEKRFAGKGAYHVEEIHALSQTLMNKIQDVKQSRGKQ